MGRKKQIDTSMYFCPYSDCSNHGAEAVSRHLMVNLHFEEVQLDEFWSFVKKKKPTAQP